MDYEEMESELDKLGVTKKDFAEQLGTYPHNINRWAHSKNGVPGYVPLALDGLRYRQQNKTEHTMELTAQDIYIALIGKELESKAARELLSEDCDLEHEVRYCLDQAWRIKEDEAEQDAILTTKNDPQKLAAFTQEVRELAEAAAESDEEE